MDENNKNIEIKNAEEANTENTVEENAVQSTEKTEEKKIKPKKKVKPPKKASNIKKLRALKPTKKNMKKFVGNNKNSLIAFGAIVLLLAIAFLFNSNNVIKIGEKQVMFSKEYSMSSKADFYVIDENIYYVSKDGMLFLDKKGEPLWSDTFTMSAPYMLNDGEYAAVADSNGKIVNVYDKTGRLYQISAAGPITTFAINPLGCCAVVSKVNDDYRVDVYSNTGETMFECARASKDGIPLGIDISDEGSVVGLTLVDYNDIKIKSSVLFYYTVKADAQATESSDGLVSAVDVPESIAAIVRFMPDNQCIVASDTSMMSIDCSGKNNFKKQWEMVFENYVTAFNIVDNKEIAVAYGEAIDLTKESAISKENTISWYTKGGRQIGSVKADDRINALFASDMGTIANVDKSYTAYTSRGRELWKYQAVQNVKSMQFYDSQDRVILVTPTKMQLLDVKKGVTMEEETVAAEEEKAVETTTAKAETQTAAQ